MAKRTRLHEMTEDTSHGHKFPKYDDDTNPKFKLKNKQEDSSERIHHSSRLKPDNTLESDEEDDDKKETFEKMTEDDVEGAEDDYEGEEIGITPFNLKEEMEEGDFDVQGNYHFKKDKVIKDEWLDNIDWMKIKKQPGESERHGTWDDTNDAGQNLDFNELEVLRKMVNLMQAGETVTSALKRLGTTKGAKNKKRKWRKEKVYDLEAKDEEEAESVTSKNVDSKRSKEKLLELTELADEMMGAGHHNVYVDSFEKFVHKIHLLEAEERAKGPQIPEDADDDDALDVLADNIDRSGKETLESKTGTDTTNEDTEGVIKWEYKWSHQDNDVYGPFSSKQMSEWQEHGYFNDGVLVRRTDRKESQFYSSRRIDFDLYI